MINEATIDWYGPNNLIPLRKDQNTPLHKGWREVIYSKEVLANFAATGHPLGYRVPGDELIIDVDPRNGGHLSVPKLISELNASAGLGLINLGQLFVTVNTGGGGQHYYTKVNPGFKCRNELKGRWDGIEFKGFGRYVAIAGSTHPKTGLKYTFAPGCATQKSLLPHWLADQIQRPVGEVNSQNNQNAATITPSQLGDILSQLPIEDFRGEYNWYPMMCACHDATEGHPEARRLFLEWSESDPAYRGFWGANESRWDSLTWKEENITVATLISVMKEYGVKTFAAPPTEHDLEMLGELPAAPTQERRDDTENNIAEALGCLNGESTASDIDRVLELIKDQPTLKMEEYLLDISSKSGKEIRLLRKALNEIRKTTVSAATDNMVVAIAEHIYKHEYKGCRILHAANQQFWTYDGIKWGEIAQNLIEQKVYTYTRDLCVKLKYNVSSFDTLVKRVLYVLQHLSATDRDMYAPQLSSVINTNNYEIEFDGNRMDLYHHRKDKYLINAIDIDYDANGTCPLFIHTLRGIFGKYPEAEREDIIRHLFELMGYIMQPYKNIPTWVYLAGAGDNGKTLFLRILGRLLGPLAVHKAINDLDTKRDSHALEAIIGKLAVIDEDVCAKTLLPADMLKKISENKPMTANPKFKRPVDFENTATVIFAANEHPKVNDLSHGLRRRAMVVDFNRTFTEADKDKNLYDKIVNQQKELPGILNQCLYGLQRLRARGSFLVPAPCQLSAKKWFEKSHSINDFLGDIDYVKLGEGLSCKFKALWLNYKSWCAVTNNKSNFTRANFQNALEALGYEVVRDARGVWYAAGIDVMNNIDVLTGG